MAAGMVLAARQGGPDRFGKDRGCVTQNASSVKTISRFLRSGLLLATIGCVPRPAAADPVGLQWPQGGGPGAPVYITYSYSNLLDGTFLLATPAALRAATEEAFSLWAAHAPLHFIELADAGPLSADLSYAADGHPQIRIGHHDMPELAHAYYPGADGLAGDVHFASGIPWSVGIGHWNFLEAVTHELGHTLGLDHELDEDAIMNPSYPSHRFDGLGSAFLFQADIRSLQAVYGAGIGSVRALEPLDPTPEPATCLLVGVGLAALVRARRRQLLARGTVCASDIGFSGPKEKSR